MKLYQLTSYLGESARPRYEMMYANLFPRGSRYIDSMNTNLNWARKVLKREDRIVWYMRLVILNQLWQIVNDPGEWPDIGITNAATPEGQQILKRYDDKIKQLLVTTNLGRFAELYKTNPRMLASLIPDTRNALEHFMGVPDHRIHEYIFRNETPIDLRRTLQQYEQDWQQNQSENIDMTDDEDATPVVQFSDGSAWFNLHRAKCDIEAGAMGHCGNSGNPKENDTILSYRVPRKVQGKVVWRPSMTFILNKRTGMLGEMKGRQNDKPAPQYHPQIIELLKQDWIKGIVGGGYKPENNFAITDLPKNEQAVLLKEKPALGGVGYMIKGLKIPATSPEVIAMVGSLIDSYGAEDIEYNEAEEAWIIDTYKTVDQFISLEGGRTAQAIMGGDMFIDSGPSADVRSIGDFLGDVRRKKPAIFKTIVAYAEKKYSELFEEHERDPNDPDDLAYVLDDAMDNVYYDLTTAYEDGWRSGSESAAYNELIEWMKGEGLCGDFENMGLRLYYHAWDAACFLGIPARNMALELSHSDSALLETVYDKGSWNVFDLQEFKSSRDWSDFNEEEALESLENNLRIEVEGNSDETA